MSYYIKLTHRSPEQDFLPPTLPLLLVANANQILHAQKTNKRARALLVLLRISIIRRVKTGVGKGILYEHAIKPYWELGKKKKKEDGINNKIREKKEKQTLKALKA